MSNFEKAKYYYDNGLWDIDKLRKVTAKGYITAEEFEEITGKPL